LHKIGTFDILFQDSNICGERDAMRSREIMERKLNKKDTVDIKKGFLEDNLLGALF